MRRRKRHANCILLAVDLRTGSGRARIRELVSVANSIPIIIVSDTTAPELQRAAMMRGAVDVIELGAMTAYLSGRLQSALRVPSNEAAVPGIPGLY